MTVLVTGATGTVGAHVVRELRGRGVATRAFVRDPDRARQLLGAGVELATGDFADPGSLARALEGTDRLFLACANVPDQVAYECAAIDAAAAAGTRLLVKLSGPRADVGSPLVFERWHGAIERHLAGSGVPAVLLHPSAFMTNLLAYAEPVARDGVLPAPAGQARVSYVDPRDVAAAAAAVLDAGGPAGRSYTLTGPEAVTFDRIAADLAAALGRPVRYVDVPDGAARAAMVAAGLPPMVADAIVAVFGSYRAGAMARTTGAVRELTGREPGSVARFARDHAALFATAPAPA